MNSEDGPLPPVKVSLASPVSGNTLPIATTVYLPSATVPLDLASRTDHVMKSIGSSVSITAPRGPSANIAAVPLRLRYPQQLEVGTQPMAGRPKVSKGNLQPATLPTVHRFPVDPRQARVPFKVEQIVRMNISDPRPQLRLASPSPTSMGQAIRMSVPLQKVIGDGGTIMTTVTGTLSAAVTAAAIPSMTSIVRGETVLGQSHSAVMQPIISQASHLTSSVAASSVQYTSHVPRGPAAIANITVQKSAAVATPITRPSVTMTSIPASKMSSSVSHHVPISLTHTTMPTNVQVKDVGGVMLPSSIPIARHPATSAMHPSMLMSPVRADNPVIQSSSPDKSRLPENPVSKTTSVASQSDHSIVISSGTQQKPPLLKQVDEKTFLRSVVSSTTAGVITSGTLVNDSSNITMNSQLGAALTAPHPHSTSISLVHSGSPYISQATTKIFQQSHMLPTSPVIAQRSVASKCGVPQQVVHTVAPITLQNQPTSKPDISTSKSMVITSAVPLTTSTRGVVTTATNVPIAKVYPQQVTLGLSGRSSSQPANLSNRSHHVSSGQQHLASFTSVRLPSSATSLSTAVTSTVTVSLPNTSITTQVATPSDRTGIAVDFASSVPYGVLSSQGAYYYGHQRLERIQQPTNGFQPKAPSSGVQNRPVLRTGTQQPVRLGQMVVTVDPSRPHPVALRTATSSTASVPLHSESVTISATVSAVYPVTTSTTPISHSTISSNNVSTNNLETVMSAVTTSVPIVSHNVITSTPTNHPPASSPRPSILRKRPSDISVAGVKKNLMAGIGCIDLDNTNNRATALLKSPMKTSEVGHDRHVEDKPITIKQEPLDTIQESNADTSSTGPGTPSSNSNGSTGTPVYETSPRKKPRKQQLHANELKEVHSSDGEEKPTIRTEREEYSKYKVKQSKEDNSSSKWEEIRKQQMTLMNTYRHSWKSRHNHFLKHADIKCKDDKKVTVNDLANQKYITQKINGWKLHHLSVQIDDLVELEDDAHEKLSSFLSHLEKVPETSNASDEDKDIHRTNELIKGNLQRCRLIRDQMKESKAQVFKVFEHKPHIIDIINKYVSKRSLKKRERL